MENILKKLNNELMEKKMTLLNMDNKIQEITKSTTSLFDTEEECLKQLSCGYYIKNDNYIIVGFEILDKKENNLETYVKINYISIY